MNFRSDNEAPVAPAIMQALIECNQGHADAYAGDLWSQKLDNVFGAIFETELRVLPLVSGTAANSLACAHMLEPYGAILCHNEAHMAVDECGAPEFFSGGAKLLPLNGENGKLCPANLESRLSTLGLKGDHDPVAQAISITQATECGTVYSPNEISAISAIAKQHKLSLHMDGARFANAVSSLSCKPADISWKAGVDCLSFGATKNGAMAAEALIVFNPDKFAGLTNRRMKAGHLLSKMRFVSSQLLAYLEEDLWLKLAQQANDGASRMARALSAHPNANVHHPCQANEIFVYLNENLHEQLSKTGFRYHPWPGEPGLYRFVVAYDVKSEHIDLFEQVLASAECL